MGIQKPNDDYKRQVWKDWGVNKFLKHIFVDKDDHIEPAMIQRRDTLSLLTKSESLLSSLPLRVITSLQIYSNQIFSDNLH